MDKASYLERLTAVCLALQNFPALERTLRENYTLAELTALLEHPRGGVRGAAALALGAIGDYSVVQALAQRLHDEDITVRTVAEQALWVVWLRAGDKTIDRLLRDGAQLVQEKRFNEAIEVFSEIIARRPDFSEGYNQRAIARYLNGNYERSLADCRKVVELNPAHFGAWAGMGHCYLQLGDKRKALDAYQRALQINPNMAQIQFFIEQLRRELQG